MGVGGGGGGGNGAALVSGWARTNPPYNWITFLAYNWIAFLGQPKQIGCILAGAVGAPGSDADSEVINRWLSRIAIGGLEIRLHVVQLSVDVEDCRNVNFVSPSRPGSVITLAC